MMAKSVDSLFNCTNNNDPVKNEWDTKITSSHSFLERQSERVIFIKIY